MKTELVTITPEMAKTFFAKNVHNNRTVNGRLVDKYARDMKNGNWHITHQGIAFNENGELVDGQHRLLAIMTSNTPVDMMVSYDVPNDSMFVIDSNKARTYTDQAKIARPDDHLSQQASIHAIIRMIPVIKFGVDDRKKMSTTEVLNELDRHRNLYNFLYGVQKKGKLLKNSGVQTAIVSALANEVPLGMVMLWVDCLAYNYIEKETSEVNYRAIFDFKDWFLNDRKMAGTTRMAKTVCQKAERSIYCFIENLSKTTKISPFRLSADGLDIVNDIVTESAVSDVFKKR